jgi:hypothetical protein
MTPEEVALRQVNQMHWSTCVRSISELLADGYDFGADDVHIGEDGTTFKSKINRLLASAIARELRHQNDIVAEIHRREGDPEYDNVHVLAPAIA